MKIKMYLVTQKGEPRNAYIRKLTAQVYASSFSKPNEMAIIEGHFIANNKTKPANTHKEDK